MKKKYKDFNFRSGTLDIINKANEIIEDYREQGFDLTLRQLYYQFVSKDLIPNTEKSYTKLGNIINDGRLAGKLDWTSIIDRTRNIRKNSHWNDPAEILEAVSNQYQIDKWENQDFYCEVWIEKDALIGVISNICEELDVTYFSCRGYVSQSEMWRASQRFISNNGKHCILFHFGDHDPSGIDMTRDIQDRLTMFKATVNVQRIALTMRQIRQYNPPPNPAKSTDSRFANYINEYGDESWELDALEPNVIVNLIRENILGMRTTSRWNSSKRKENKHKSFLNAVSERWEDVKKYLEE